MLTLLASLTDSPLVRPLAWATAAIALYAIWDYQHAATRARRPARWVNLRQSQLLLTMPKETKARLTWQRGMEFDGSSGTAPPIQIDADNRTAPSPMALLLLAAGSCTGSDIVAILEKMRVSLTGFRSSLRHSSERSRAGTSTCT